MLYIATFYSHFGAVRFKKDCKKENISADIVRAKNLEENKLGIKLLFIPEFKFLSEEEKKITLEKIRQLEEISGKNVYISVEPFKSFYSAEEEHQDYYRKHPAEFQQELVESGRIKLF